MGLSQESRIRQFSTKTMAKTKPNGNLKNQSISRWKEIIEIEPEAERRVIAIAEIVKMLVEVTLVYNGYRIEL